MADTVAFDLNLKPVMQIVAAVIAITLACGYFFKIKWIQKIQNLIEQRLETKWKFDLTVLTIFYFITGVAAKFTQYRSLSFSAQDFWVFEDMLRWMSQGQPFITRFAPQGIGPVQHGAVHPFLSYFVAVPFVWLFGSAVVAVAFNPLVLALGGWMTGLVTYRQTKWPLLSLALPLAFWMVEWTNRTLMYDTHPEAFYPFAVAWVAYVSVGARRGQNFGDENGSLISRILFILAWAFLTGVKQDSLIIAGSIWLALTLTKKWTHSAAAAAALVFVGVTICMASTVAHFRSGSWGPLNVAIGEHSIPVTVPIGGAGALGGETVSGASSLIRIFENFSAQAGGTGALVSRIVTYPFHSPFVVILLIAPWIWLKRESWILLLPLILCFGMVAGQVAGLQNYYAIPLISLLWLAIIFTFDRESRTKKASVYQMIWLLLICAMHGARGPTFSQPSSIVETIKTDFSKLNVDQMSRLGIVSTRFLPLISMDRVWSERGEKGRVPAFVRWAIFPHELKSYEDQNPLYMAWKEALRTDPEWSFETRGSIDLFRRR